MQGNVVVVVELRHKEELEVFPMSWQGLARLGTILAEFPISETPTAFPQPSAVISWLNRPGAALTVSCRNLHNFDFVGHHLDINPNYITIFS